MPIPFAALAAAGIITKLAADAYASNKQDKYNRRATDYEKQQSRKAAIERAMTGKYSSGPFGISRVDPPKPPSMAGPGIVGGLGEIVATLAGRKL